MYRGEGGSKKAKNLRTYYVPGPLHIGFLIGAIFFVQQQSVSQAIQSLKNVYVSLQDLPTVTYFFPESGETLVYGDDFLIEAKVSDDKRIQSHSLKTKAFCQCLD